jgi:tetratricopeptide (TPR) repeat protein
LRVPEKARGRLLAAERDFRKSNISQALQEVERALQADPAFAQAYAMRSLIKLSQRDASGAAQDAAMATSLDAADAQGFLALGAALNSLHEFPKAEAALRRARGLSLDLWQAQLEMAKSLYGQGQLDMALQEVDAVKQDFPDVHLVRGNVLMRLHRRNEAASEFNLFARQAPRDPRIPQILQIVASVAQPGQPAAAQ